MKTERPTARRVLGMVIGIVIISLGIAIFKQSHLGNDSITALNIRLSELLGISLGVQNICTNLVFLVVEFIWAASTLAWAPWSTAWAVGSSSLFSTTSLRAGSARPSSCPSSCCGS